MSQLWRLIRRHHLAMFLVSPCSSPRLDRPASILQSLNSPTLGSVRGLASMPNQRYEPVKNEMQQQKKPSQEQAVNWGRRLGVILGIGAVGTICAIALTSNQEAKKPNPRIDNSRHIEGATLSIGGPFKLLDQNRKVVTERDFYGRWSLVYFGYTHCPDDCPEELKILAEATNKLNYILDTAIVPVLISLDPERDHCDQLREYVKEFHPRMVGLTGEPSDVRQVARKFRIFYRRIEEEQWDYLIQHSSIIYLMDKKMQFVKSYGPEYGVEDLVNSVVDEIKKKEEVDSKT